MDDSVILKKSNINGPTLVIFGAIHGDEICGPEAFKRVIPSLQIKRGSVYFIIGNPEALQQRKRSIDTNLNRLFNADSELKPEVLNTLEYYRSRELFKYLDQADAVLDIHSSASQESRPFIISEAHSFEIAQILPADIVTSGWDELETGTTDYYMNRRMKNGLVIECGNHHDRKATDIAESAIKSFLGYFDMIDYKPVVSQKQFMQVKTIYHTTTNSFRLTKPFADFEPVNRDQIIGFDRNKEVKPEFDGAIIFARNRDRIGAEAFLLAARV